MSEQHENQEQVAAPSCKRSLSFMRPGSRWGDFEFHVDQLRRHMRFSEGEIAPASPDRVMRSLRPLGALDYQVLSRSESLYPIIDGHLPKGIEYS
jgi:hypothetical protein